MTKILRIGVRLLSCFIPMRAMRKKVRETLYEYIELMSSRALCKTIYRETKTCGKILVFINNDFFRCILTQRSRYIATELTKLNNLVVYFCDGYYKRCFSKYLYIRGMSGVGNKLFKRLKPLGKGNTLVQKYLVIYSTSYWLNVEDIIRLKQEGFKIIYSYIDEISSEISSETTKLLEIFNNLEKIDPVLIVSSAKHLHMEMLQRFPKEKILLVSNGVEVENFNKKFENIPKDMKDIVKNNKPTIGYYGGIAPWIDYKLLNKLSILRPNYNFVYIGVDYNGFCLKELKIRDNVYYLGSKQYEKLGEYSNLFDVCMIPFKEGEIAKKTSPLKLFEYMAARKPVVVTKDLLECYGYEGVLVSKNHDDFIANVDKALKLAKDENVKNKLLEYAVQNTWKKKAQAIDNKLTELN